MPSGIQWRNAAIVGALMLGDGMGCTAFAEQTISSGLVVAFIAVSPLLVVVTGLPFGVRPARREILGILVGLAGVMMLTRGDGFRASPSGLAAIVLACGGWALGSVLSQHKLPLAQGAMGFASEMLCGGIVLLAVAWAGRETPRLATASASAWLAWGYLVVFGSLIAFNAYMLLLRDASPALATSYSYVNPVIGLLLGVGVGGERVTAWEWASAGVVLAGVMVLLFRPTASRRRAAA
jgi:drug/metabolite transporter (DMT)-like permease